jgi:HSP20 family molecular chaperone IbpA
MWAGPRVVVIHAAFPGVCPEHLRIDVEGTRLAFTIPPRPLSPGGASDRRRANARSRAFRCTVELPYEVDTEQAEVQKEHGWISAVLRKKDPDSAGCRNARGEGDTIRKTTGKKSAFTQPLCAEQGRRPA